MHRSERLMKLLELLHNQPGLEAQALAKACGTSPRTLQRDLDALGAARFPVYFARGSRPDAPTLLPAVRLPGGVRDGGEAGPGGLAGAGAAVLVAERVEAG